MRTLICIVFIINSINSQAQNTIITGVVKDCETKQPLPYSNIFLPNLKTGGTTDSYGKFKLTIYSDTVNPVLIVSYIGYKTDTIPFNIGSKSMTIFLKANGEKLNEIVITGTSKATLLKENPISIISISNKAIERTLESNIIDVLVKNSPGLNAVKTGPNISKPFIRGLGYNRVLTQYDGIRQEGQQWGDEHGIEVDAYNIEKAEVIKGPASLMYGSDALAGVVSLIPHIPFEKDSVIRGKLFAEYQSNNGLVGNGFRLGFSSKHWLWALRGSYRIAKNYSNNIDGRVYNTSFQEKNASALFGYTNDKGYSHLNFTIFDNLQGIPDGSRDSLTRKFTQQIYEDTMDNIKNRPIVSNEQLNSYKLSSLNQHIQHYRIYTNHHYQIRKGEIDALLAFQQSTRREYNHPTQTKQAGMYVQLNTINYGLRYNVPQFLNIETTIGINGMYQNNKNKNGTDFPIPDYNLFDIGSYLFAKWKHNNLTISGGVRYDIRYLSSNNFYVKSNQQTKFDEHVLDSAGAILQFPTFNQTFEGLSSSIGTTYKISEKISVKANVARGYRAPNISEIASNGLDPGAHIVYIGNKNFVPEFSFQQDFGIIVNFKDISGTASIFNNNIQHYIYLSQLVDEQGNAVVIVQGNKTFQYQQSSAHLYGFEAMLAIHPQKLKGFNFNTNFSTVYGYNTKVEFENKGINGEYLPFIPPLKILSSINQTIKTNWKFLPAFDLKTELDYNGSQNRYLALQHTETSTPSYLLLNAGINMNVNYSKKNTLQFMVQVNNIFDVAYQSNLSRLKYFEYYSKSSSGHSGIYGMGRNICMKLIIPI